MTNPQRSLVSAVLPNYNDGATVGEALEALLNQSYRNVEVVVVDDASTDNSVEIVSQFVRRDSRVKLIRHEANKGPIVAQLTGFQHAAGDYLFGPSANDKVLPGFLEALVSVLDSHPSAGLAICDITYIDDPAQDDSPLARAPVYVSPGQLVGALAKQVFLIGGAASLVRRTDWAGAGWLRPELRWMADYFAMHVVAFRKGLCYVPMGLYAIRTPVYSQITSRSAGQRAATESLLGLLHSEAYDDVRMQFVNSGILASVPGFFRLVLQHRRLWPLLSPALLKRGLSDEVKGVVRPVLPMRLRRRYRQFRAATSPPLLHDDA